MKLDQLQKIAEAATPGPWFAADWGVDDGPDLTTIEAHEPEGLLPPGYSSIWPGGVRCINVASTRAGSNPLPDAAYIAAVSPAVVLRLIAVARAARGALGLRDERVHIAATERSAATRTEELLRNGEAAEQAWAALRSALSDLDAQQEQT